MNDHAPTLPRIEFSDWSVSFPSRGRHSFLSAEDLRTPRADEAPSAEQGVWLVRAESHVALVIPGGVEVMREGTPVIGLAVLHHGEEIFIAGHKGRFHEVQRLYLEPGNRLLESACPQCRGSFEKGQPVLRCPLCGAAYHEDCWNFLIGKRCYSRNCRFSPGPLAET